MELEIFNDEKNLLHESSSLSGKMTSINSTENRNIKAEKYSSRKPLYLMLITIALMVICGYILTIVLHFKNKSQIKDIETLKLELVSIKAQIKENSDSEESTNLQESALHGLMTSFEDKFNLQAKSIEKNKENLHQLNNSFKDILNSQMTSIENMKNLDQINNSLQDINIARLHDVVNTTRIRLVSLNATCTEKLNSHMTSIEKNTENLHQLNNSVKEKLKTQMKSIEKNMKNLDQINNSLQDSDISLLLNTVNNTRMRLMSLNATYTEKFNSHMTSVEKNTENLHQLNNSIRDSTNFTKEKLKSQMKSIEKSMKDLERLNNSLQDIDIGYLLDVVNNTRIKLASLNATYSEQFSYQMMSIETIKVKLDNITSSVEDIQANRKLPDNIIPEVCASQDTTCTVCPTTTFHFPRDDQTTDYVQYTLSFPTLSEFTICMWLETDDYSRNRDTIFSYAVPNRHNELWIFFENANDIGLGLVSSSASAAILSHSRFVGMVTVHMCVWFSSVRRRAGLYLNGTTIDTQTKSAANVQGGGTLILGQDQDSVGGSFSAPQSYQGNITNVIIWPRVLTDEEISIVARLCICPIDHVVAMTSNLVRVFGNAYSSKPRQCPTV